MALTWGALADTWAGLEDTWLGTLNLDTVVELGSFTGFTLDSPVLGVLDLGILDGGISFVPVPQGVFSVSTSRGRNRDLERTNAGQVSVSLRNQDRFFDPKNNSSEIQSAIVPRTPIRLGVDGFPVFQGFVDDWAFSYSPGGDSVASFQGSDAFALFARNLNAGGSAVEELTGARLNRVLNQASVAWPAAERDIEDGNSTLAAGTLEGNVLSYMGDVVEGSEQGLVFISKDGKVAFRERLIEPVTSAVTFADNGLGVPYEDVRISFGTDLMVNQAVVVFPGGTATAEDLTSQVVYGITERTLDTQLSNLSQSEAIADYLITRYSEPEYRIESVTVNLRGLSSAQVLQVVGLELGDQADIVFTPNGVGETISLRNRVIGVSHDVGIAEHRVTFNFEQLPFTFFILDDATFGRLDDDAAVLGF
jgi:hypothetical protein